jgi:hypothetical protein
LRGIGEGVVSGVDRPHGVRFTETGFTVIHRRREYGLFDYQWTPEMDGVELHYQGRKFGEICSPAEIQADLKEFRLPRRVVEVATIVLGNLLAGILAGQTESQRHARIWSALSDAGLKSFLPEV